MLAVMAVYAMGFATAIPVGPTQLEIAKRSLNGYLSSALMIIVGQLISDIMYGIIALFGIAPFLQHPKVVAVFWLLNAIILVVLAIWTIRQNNSSPQILEHSRIRLKKHNIAFFVGFSLAITNPLMIVWWLLGARILVDTGLVAKYSTLESVIFLSVGSLGLGSYLALLAFVVLKTRGFISEHAITRITVAFSVLLLGLAAYIGARSAFVLMS
jgi:threonine/homoserine/homoserine lactone efflux protein